MFELQIVDPVPGLETLGAQVQLRELRYGALRAVMQAAQAPERAGEALLAAALYIDGAPVGLEGLDAVPGRFAGAIARAMARCLELHGMTSAATEPPRAANDAEADDAGLSASAPGEA